jgi:hypothetical protein
MLGRTAWVLVLCGVLGLSPQAVAAQDERAPRVAFTTSSGDVVVGAPAETDVSTVRGTAADKGSGVKRVKMLYCNGSVDDDGGWSCGNGVAPAFTSVRATVECSSPARTSCLWSAPAPTRPGNYLVFAEARDKAGNERTAGPIEITVV